MEQEAKYYILRSILAESLLSAQQKCSLSNLQRNLQIGRCRERGEKSRDDTDKDVGTGAVYGTGSGAESMQKCSWLYLQRRHDIPCPLKLATERCSPRSCCRCTSQANTSTAKRKPAENPIGLTGNAPNSSKWRH